MNHVDNSKQRARRRGGALYLSLLITTCAVGCGDEDKGTDIEVPAGGKAGNSSQGGSGSGKAGNGGKAGSDNQSGSPSDDGGEGGMEPSAGSSTGGNAGSSGAGGNAGASGGGMAGMSGNAGTAGGGGTAGSAGAGGSAGSAGTAGAAGNGGTAGTAGTGGATTTCGDGAVEGAEECDGGAVGTPWKGSRLCSDACEAVATQACVDCEQAGDCFASSDNCFGPAATPFTLAEIGVCYDVIQCIQDADCLDGAGSLGKCYCGTLSTSACGAAPFNLNQTGAPNGPCAAIMQLGNPGVTTNTGILGGLTNKSRPAGAAGQRLNCDKTDTACAELCGITPAP